MQNEFTDAEGQDAVVSFPVRCNSEQGLFRLFVSQVRETGSREAWEEFVKLARHMVAYREDPEAKKMEEVRASIKSLQALVDQLPSPVKLQVRPPNALSHLVGGAAALHVFNMTLGWYEEVARAVLEAQA